MTDIKSYLLDNGFKYNWNISKWYSIYNDAFFINVFDNKLVWYIKSCFGYKIIFECRKFDDVENVEKIMKHYYRELKLNRILNDK